MARNYLIDGSNSVYAIFRSAHESRAVWDIEARRFISMIGDWAAGQIGVEVEIVIDGGFRKLDQGSGAPNLRIIFSMEESADSVILERLAVSRFKGRSATVVTRDRALAEAAKAEGARVASPEDFWSRVTKGFDS